MNEPYFKYEIFPHNTYFCTFMDTPIPGNNSPGYFEVFKSFDLTGDEFVEKANNLFETYNVKIPHDFKVLDADQFAICISCCIILKEHYGIDVEKILKKELLNGKKMKDLYHATSLASVALYYLKNDNEVDIVREKKDQFNPDLIINGNKSEIKVIQEPYWVNAFNKESGKTEKHQLFEDVCFDIGNFIAKNGSGYKGIKQSDIIFADLSLKSFGWLKKILEKDNEREFQFPEIKKHRIIFFARRILDFTGFYIDFDPMLWALIKDREIEHQFGIYPD